MEAPLKIRTWEVSRVYQKDQYPGGQYQLHVKELPLWLWLADKMLLNARLCCQRYTWRAFTWVHWALDKTLMLEDSHSYSINVTRDVAWQVDEHFVGQVERDVDDD